MGFGTTVGVGVGPGMWRSNSASFTGPLDGVSATIHAAYSPSRRLLSSYTDSTQLIRLRRAIDDAESDFGWDADGNLDTTAITADGYGRVAADFVRANSEYLELSSTDSLRFSTGAFYAATFVVFRGNLSSTQTVFGYGHNDNHEQYRLYMTGSGALNFRVRDFNDNVITVTETTIGAPSEDTVYFVETWVDADAKPRILVNRGATPDVGTAMVGGFHGGLTRTFSGEDFSVGKTLGAAGGYLDARQFMLVLGSTIPTDTERDWLYNSGVGRTLAEVEADTTLLAKLDGGGNEGNPGDGVFALDESSGNRTNSSESLTLTDNNTVGSVGGATLVTIYDQVGSNDWTQSTDSRQPLYFASGANSKPGARFDGTNHLMSADGLASLMSGQDKALSVFASCERDAADGDDTIIAWNSSSSNNPLLYIQTLGSTEVLRVRKRNDGGSLITRDGGAFSADPTVVAVVIPGTTVDGYLDGGSPVIDGAGLDADTTTLNRTTLGTQYPSTGGFGSLFDGDMYEMVLSTGDITAADINTIGGALAAGIGSTWSTAS